MDEMTRRKPLTRKLKYERQAKKQSSCFALTSIDLLGAGLNTNLFFVYFGASVISFKFLTHFLILELFTKV